MKNLSGLEQNTKLLQDCKIFYIRKLYYNIPISSSVSTDASAYVIEGILSQGTIYPYISIIAYISRFLNKAA